MALHHDTGTAVVVVCIPLLYLREARLFPIAFLIYVVSSRALQPERRYVRGAATAVGVLFSSPCQFVERPV